MTSFLFCTEISECWMQTRWDKDKGERKKEEQKGSYFTRTQNKSWHFERGGEANGYEKFSV